MTLDEAKRVARIIGTADHGCGTCVRNLVERLQLAFPEFTWATGGEKTEYRDYDGKVVSSDDEADLVETYIEVKVE